MTENDRTLRCQTALRAERLIYRGRGLIGIGKVILDFNLLSLSSALIATLIGLCYLPVPCNKK